METTPHVSPEPQTSQKEVNYEILSSPEMRAEYITLTDGLISRFAEQGTDVAIFLDKSARPVAWLVNELWDTLAPRKPGTDEPLPKPDIKFLNIDREQWGPYVGRSEDKTGGIDASRIPEQSIEDLRKIFAPVHGVSSPEDTSLFTGKKVGIVDEVRMSGDTLVMAEKILARAFPDAADIDGFYWMPKPATIDRRSGAVIGGEVPIWYSDRVVTGRLVAGRDSHKSMQSNSSRQRAGRYWLSTNFRDAPDLSGRQLKAETKKVAEDLRAHVLPYILSPIWSNQLEPVEDRVRRLDGIDVEEYKRIRREAGSNADFIRIYDSIIKAKKTSKS